LKFRRTKQEMIPQRFAFICVVLLTLASWAGAQTWTPLAHQPSFTASTALLLTDGTVMVQAQESSAWWRLTPDKTGNYINGTWTQLASLPSGYAPLYYASAVLPDGRVVIEGGEFNITGPAAETTRGAIYNPVSNSWISITPPSGVTQIGDASGIVLPNGSFMLGPVNSSSQWILNPSTLNWTLTGSGKADANSEENWALLPNGNVLTVDAQNGTNSEIYSFVSGAWSSAGGTIVTLPSNNGDIRFVPEVGPALLRPDGTVFATGATSSTAIYNPNTGAWSAGPTFPNSLSVADGPAALLPNGNVLVDASPFQIPPSQFFEFNGTSLISVSSPPNTGNDPSFVGRMLVLPTGQILFTHGSNQIQIYTPQGTYQNAWRPTISSSLPNTLNPSSINNFISGTQFNGLSQGASYGDDAQSATNYPLVQIINNATGDLAFARTHDHSTMAVATGSALVSTLFDVPANIETGASTLRVVANGIPSAEMPINVSFGSSANCPETKCTLVQNAYISHFTGIDCTGGEHYYTQYFGADGIRRSWDGQGFYGTALTTVTNRSWKGSDGQCHNDWPVGNTLSSFVTVYRDTQFTPVQGAYISHFTEPNCTGQESYYTKYFNSDGIRRSWDGQGSVGSIIYTATTKSWKGSDGMCHNDWTTAPYNTLDGFVRVYR
jgi:hypothetical protein